MKHARVAGVLDAVYLSGLFGDVVMVSGLKAADDPSKSEAETALVPSLQKWRRNTPDAECGFHFHTIKPG